MVYVETSSGVNRETHHITDHLVIEIYFSIIMIYGDQEKEERQWGGPGHKCHEITP